jgi:predicted transcriptional regulator
LWNITLYYKYTAGRAQKYDIFGKGILGWSGSGPMLTLMAGCIISTYRYFDFIGVDMSLKKKKIHILTILFENLQETNPQLVSSSTIAAQMNLGLPDLRQVLKIMEGMGLIQSDPDQQFNLITRKGLIWLDQQNSNVYSQTLQQKEKIVSRPRFT